MLDLGMIEKHLAENNMNDAEQAEYDRNVSAALRRLESLDGEFRTLTGSIENAGPIGRVIEATDSLIELTYAGSNQASSNPETDTAYGLEELTNFVTVIAGLMSLIRSMLKRR